MNTGWTYEQRASAARGIGAACAFLLLLIGLGFAMPWSIWAAGPNGWRAMSQTPLPEEAWGLLFVLIGGMQLWAMRQNSPRHLLWRRWLLPLNALCFLLLLWMALLSNPTGLAPWIWAGPPVLDFWSASFLYVRHK